MLGAYWPMEAIFYTDFSNVRPWHRSAIDDLLETAAPKKYVEFNGKQFSNYL